MTNDEKLTQEAQAFANKNKKKIAKELTSIEKYPQEDNPVSVFMAGSPGAGKTEVSKRLLEARTRDKKSILRIDGDDLREIFDGYDGSNSHIFNLPASIIISKMHDLALKNHQSFIFDGTFSNKEYANENIDRSLSRERFVKILYVYQNPLKAWNFVLQRELIEGRRIKKEDFIEKYFQSRAVVNYVKQKYGNVIQVDVLLKDLEGNNKLYFRNVDNIDNHIPEKYTKNDLEKLL